MSNSGEDRIHECKFTSDERYVYFYFKLRKNRSYATPLAFGFDFDDTGSLIDNNKMTGCEILVSCQPFSNASGATPVCVNGFVTNAKINGTTDASAVYSKDYDDGSDISSNSSNHYLEVSILRNKLPNLPASGVSFNIGASFNYYFTGFTSLALED